MHLIDLGIMRRLLSFLFGTEKDKKIPVVPLDRQTIETIDKFLVSLRKYIPRIDFARHKHLRRWKETKLRTFLHYLGVVVLKQYLPTRFLKSFFTSMLPLSCCRVQSGV